MEFWLWCLWGSVLAEEYLEDWVDCSCEYDLDGVCWYRLTDQEQAQRVYEHVEAMT